MGFWDSVKKFGEDAIKRDEDERYNRVLMYKNKYKDAKDHILIRDLENETYGENPEHRPFQIEAIKAILKERGYRY